MMLTTSGYKLNVSKYILQDGFSTADSNNSIRKMQIIRAGTFTDPRYGQFEITIKMLQEMVTNFKQGVRGVIPALDYQHNADDIAAGWFKDLFLSDDGKELWATIEMTPTGLNSLNAKEFGYTSADLDGDYVDNETQKNYGCVLLGAALTNRPVIKRMEPVIQLAEKKDPIGDKIAKLISEGYDQDQAVAIAKSMEREGKLSEGETMTDEQKKQMEDMQKQCEDYKKLQEDMGAKDPAELMKIISELKAKIAELEGNKPEAPKLEEKPEGEDEMSKPEDKAKIADLEGQLSEVKTKLELQEKTTEFNVMLSEGKAVEAQRESFVKSDMKAFIAGAVPIKLTEQGHSGAGEKIDPSKDVEDQILERAKKLSEEKKIGMKEAISEVLKTNKELAEKYSKLNG